jgi:hypothetical protein
MIPEPVYQLGLAATILFIVYLIIQLVLKNQRDNDKDNTDLAKSLVTLLTGLSTAITNNTSVLTELKSYISVEKQSTREAINAAKLEILDRFGTTDRKVDLILKILDDVQKSLDDTLISQKEDDDGTSGL